MIIRESSSNGKPFDANKYWKDILQPNLQSEEIARVPIISIMRAITNYEDNTQQGAEGDAVNCAP